MPEDLCPHLDICGGCTAQRVPYPEQLAAKATHLQELLAGAWDHEVEVVPSPARWHYRNKAELKFDREQFPEPPPPGTPRRTVLGYRRQGRWYHTFDVHECRIMSPAVPALLQGVRDWYTRHDYAYYDQRSGEGLLKHLVLREAKNTGQRMVILLTAHDDFDAESFAAAVQQAVSVDSVVHGISPPKSDVAFSEHPRTLAGSDAIRETLTIDPPGATFQRSFLISPFGFFQVNPTATELLYTHLRHWLQALPAEHLYDLYGGSGGIALSVADRLQRITSVEEFPGATADGEQNARDNGVDNVAFVTAKVEKWLGARKLAGDYDADAAVVLDPPRAGLHPKALRRLVEFGPRDICYVACNPKNLARELPDFLETYELTGVRAFDLFPHTRHVELVACLRRR